MNNHIIFDDVFDEPEPLKDDGTPCKGLIYRCYMDSYYTKERCLIKQDLRLLKRKSCKKECCDQCDAIIDYLNDIGTGELENLTLERGKMYKIGLRDTSSDTDWGYEYDCELEVSDYEDPTE